MRAAVVELKITVDGNPKVAEVRLARSERRQQLTRAVAGLLELIVMRNPYEALIQKASLVDQHVRFFFPKGSSYVSEWLAWINESEVQEFQARAPPSTGEAQPLAAGLGSP